ALRPRPRLAGRARLRDPRRRARDRPGRAPPPRAAQLRGHRRRLGRRPPGGRAAGKSPPALRTASAFFAPDQHRSDRIKRSKTKRNALSVFIRVDPWLKLPCIPSDDTIRKGTATG